MPEKGFTATFISHSGKTHRRYDISGWKLHLLRILLALFIFITVSAVIVLAFGLLSTGETESLREEVSRLQDSLITRRNLELRLSAIEAELEEIMEFREKIENVSGLIPLEDDSLE